MESWPYDEGTLAALATRENYPCLWCGRNYRMRELARRARAVIRGSSVYEAATFGVFSGAMQRTAREYVQSEYMGDTFEPGTVVNGRRHEDVQRLSFPDASLDVVITSEVFEHVADPWRGFSEVRRVLRRGGRHLFTVPYVAGKPTQSRSRLRPVYHVDPRRPEGIAVVTDFGDDLPLLLKQYSFTTEVVPFPPQQPVGRVYISTAI